MFKNLKEKNIKNSEKVIEKSSEEKTEKRKITKEKMYMIMGAMWSAAVILGFVNHRIEARAKSPEIVFTRTDGTVKEENDKIYVFYPKDNSITNEEIVVPKVKSKDEFLKATIFKTLKKLEEGNFVPEIDKKDIVYYILDKKIYLDLPEKIFDNVTNAKSELLIIYSFVNSLTNAGGIDSVRILINNADLEKVKYANLLKDYKYKKDI